MHLYFNGPKSVFLQDISLRAEWLPIVPSYTTDLTEKPRLAKVQMGDGYAQRSPDGINILPLLYNVVFLNRRNEIQQALVNFFRGSVVIYTRAPHEFFWWVPPFPNDSKPLKFVCEQWKTTYDEYNAATLTCTFEQVFDPG